MFPISHPSPLRCATQLSSLSSDQITIACSRHVVCMSGNYLFRRTTDTDESLGAVENFFLAWAALATHSARGLKFLEGGKSLPKARAWFSVGFFILISKLWAFSFGSYMYIAQPRVTSSVIVHEESGSMSMSFTPFGTTQLTKCK